MIAAQKNIVSIGRLAGMLDTTRDRIADAAEVSGIAPVETIDGVPFFDSADAERIREHLNNKPNAKLARGAR